MIYFETFYHECRSSDLMGLQSNVKLHTQYTPYIYGVIRLCDLTLGAGLAPKLPPPWRIKKGAEAP